MRRFINDKYKISFNVPTTLTEYISLAEAADEKNDLGNYLIYADEIDTLAKSCCESGDITPEMWDVLVLRYCQ